MPTEREAASQLFGGERLRLCELRHRGRTRYAYELWIAPPIDGDLWPNNRQLMLLADSAGAPFGGDARLAGTQPDGTRVYTVWINID